ncbi:MAG: divalent-cation tolerance protein CutA [Sphingobium sp.]
MSGITILYTVFPDRESALRVVRQCVRDGLTACANILAPCSSVYEWEGDIVENEEIPVIFKTTAARVDQLIEELSIMHPYDVPAILSWPIVRAPHSFAKWVNEQVHR